MTCKRCGVPLRGRDIRETPDYCGFCSRKFGILTKTEYRRWVSKYTPESELVSHEVGNFDMDRYDILDRMVRAGDVLMYPIENIPNYAQETYNPILAYGEKSGHKHLLKGQFQVFETPEPQEMQTLSYRKVLTKKFVKVLETVLPQQQTVLVHENKKGQQADHKPRTLQPGNYMVVQETEWQPFEEMVKEVQD